MAGSSDEERPRPTARRQFLRLAGAGSLAALAGCNALFGGPDEGTPESTDGGRTPTSASASTTTGEDPTTAPTTSTASESTTTRETTTESSTPGTPTPVPAPVPADGWPSFGADLANTGHAPWERSHAGEGTAAWEFETDAAVRGSPAVATVGESNANGDGGGGAKTVFVGSDDGNVYALAAADGAERWRFTAGDAVVGCPAVVGAGAGGIPGAGSDESVVVTAAGDPGGVYALDATDGAERWHFRAADSVLSSPAAVGADGGLPTGTEGTVYVGSDDGNVYALAAADGSEVWRFETGDRVRGSPAVAPAVATAGGADGGGAGGAETVFVGSDDGNVYALDAADGTEVWHFPTGRPVGASPAVAADAVYVGGAAGLYALDAADGTERWRFPLRESVSTSAPAVAGNAVYVGGMDHRVYAVSLGGAERWRFETGDWVVSSPAVVDGRVYVGSWDRRVYALE